MIVVADTTPLNYLIRMHEAELLNKLYGAVVVPFAVLEEMRAVGAPPDVRAWASSPPDWVQPAHAASFDPDLPRQLGAGEREAISLALQIHADVLLMDDQPARLAAEARGLFVSGTLSVLLQASRAGMVDFEHAMIEIKRLGFRISADVEARMRLLSRKP